MSEGSLELQSDEKLCEICTLEEFKYKCPRCMKKTCSLKCSKQHKTDFNCSGQQYNPEEYISSTTLKEHNEEVLDEEDQDENDNVINKTNGEPKTSINNILVQRDYNFLTNVNRQLTVLKNDTWSRNKRMLLGQQRMENTQVKKFKSNTHDMELEFIQRRGCRCLLLPKGMKKSNINRSKWDKPSDCFVWSLEWIFHGSLLEEEAEVLESTMRDTRAEKTDISNTSSPQQMDFVTHKNKETETLLSIMARQPRITKHIVLKQPVPEGEEFAPKLSEEEMVAKLSELISQGALKLYTKAFPKLISSVIDPKYIIEVDPSLTINAILTNKTCIEFPTIYVSVNNQAVEKMEVVESEDELEIVNGVLTRIARTPPSESDSSSDESSSGSSDDSSSEEDLSSDSSSDSDEDEPVETPIVKETVTETPVSKPAVEDSEDSDSDDGTGVTLDFLAD